MNTLHTRSVSPCLLKQRGFTLVELMVTVAIALFLLYGLVTTVENVRQTSLNQQKLAVLQDSQRFAMTAITDVIQSAGFFPNAAAPSGDTLLSAFSDYPATATNRDFPSQQYVNGCHLCQADSNSDWIGVRYKTQSQDGVLNCQGGSNNSGIDQPMVNTFTVTGGQLVCAVNGGAWQGLVNGVTNLQILYGVKRIAGNDYNVDTYLNANQMLAPDWQAVSSVRVQLTFLNPLYAGPGSTIPQTITFDRVVQIMARAGDFTS
jgi:type IV pilus assembly protein PilW